MGGGGGRQSGSGTSRGSSQSFSDVGTGGTATALGFLPQVQQAGEQGVAQGPYTGDVVAGPQNLAGVDRFTPELPDIDRFIAAPSPVSREGLGMAEQGIRDVAPAIGQTAGNLSNFWSDVSGGAFLNPNNPALVGYTNALTQQSGEKFDRIKNAFDFSAAGSGAYWGTPTAYQANILADTFDTNLQNTLANVHYQNFLNEMARIERSGGGAAQAGQLAAAPGLGLAAIGDQGRLLDQLEVDEGVRQAQYGVEQQQSEIQNDITGARIQDELAQAGLVNDEAIWNAIQMGNLPFLGQLFGTLGAPALGGFSDATNIGTQVSSSSGGYNPGAADIIGGAANAFGSLWGNQGFGGGGGGGGGAASFYDPASFSPAPSSANPYPNLYPSGAPSWYNSNLFSSIGG